MRTNATQCGAGLALGVALVVGTLLALFAVLVAQRMTETPAAGMPPSPDKPVGSGRNKQKQKRRRRTNMVEQLADYTKLELRGWRDDGAPAPTSSPASDDVEMGAGGASSRPSRRSTTAPKSYAEAAARTSSSRPAQAGANHWRARQVYNDTPTAYAPTTERAVAVGKRDADIIYEIETVRVDSWADVFKGKGSLCMGQKVKARWLRSSYKASDGRLMRPHHNHVAQTLSRIFRRALTARNPSGHRGPSLSIIASRWPGRTAGGVLEFRHCTFWAGRSVGR